MKVYVVVEANWNVEYGYDEYSLPKKIFGSSYQAEIYKEELKANNSYSEYSVEEYEVEF